jgi:hypothetical protein
MYRKVKKKLEKSRSLKLHKIGGVSSLIAKFYGK